MNEHAVGLMSMTEVSRVFEELANTADSKRALSLELRLYVRLRKRIADLFGVHRDTDGVDDERNYETFAHNLFDRDKLRAVHVTLNEYRHWLIVNSPRLGKKIPSVCDGGLRRLSAQAVISSRWLYGVAYKLAAKAYREASLTELRDISHDLVWKIVRKIESGTSWYEPARENGQPGAWFTTTIHFLLGKRMRERHLPQPLLQIEIPSRSDSVLSELIEADDDQRLDFLESWIGKLPREEAQVIDDLFWKQKSLSEIAASLGVRKQTVCELKDKALANLRRLARLNSSP